MEAIRLDAEILAGARLAQAIAWARERALDQALLLADLTQLADESLPVGVFANGHVRGLACCYTGLPFLAVAIWSEAPEVAGALLQTLAAYQPRLRTESAYALVAEPIVRQLAQVATVEDARKEMKRVLRPQGLAPPSPAAARWHPASLGPDDLPAMEDLYAAVEAIAWTPRTIDLGPARGIYVEGELVAAAGVHFVTPWVSEIGHIVTRPAYRRQGMGEAVARAVVGDLWGRTRHIFLMHLSDNEAAARLYGRMGFEPMGTLLLTRFSLGETAT